MIKLLNGELWEEDYMRLRKDLSDTPSAASAKVNHVHEPVHEESGVCWKGAAYWVAVAMIGMVFTYQYGFVLYFSTLPW